MEGMQVRAGISDDGMRYLTTASGSTLSEDDLPGGEFEQLWNARNDPRNAAALAQHIDQVADETQWSGAEIGMAGAAGLGAAAMMPGIGPAVRGGIKATAGLGGRFAKGVYNQGAGAVKEAYGAAKPAVMSALNKGADFMEAKGRQLSDFGASRVANPLDPKTSTYEDMGEALTGLGTGLRNKIKPRGDVNIEPRKAFRSAVAAVDKNPDDRKAVIALTNLLGDLGGETLTNTITGLPPKVREAISRLAQEAQAAAPVV